MKILNQKKIPLLFPMFSLLFMILFAFTLFMSYEYSKQATADVNTFTLAKMRHSYQNTLFTFDNIRSFGVSTYQDPAINYWLITDQRDPLGDADAFKAASRFASLQPFIHSIYLINTKTRKVIDTSRSLQDFSEFQDQGIIRKILEEHPSYISYFNHNVGAESFMAMMIPSTQSTTINAGYLVILLDKAELQKFLLQNEDTIGLQINITNNQKQLILGESFSDNELNDRYYAVPKIPFETIEYAWGKEKKKISSAELPNVQWVMHFIVDEAYLTQNIRQFKQKMTLWCMILMIAMFLLFIWSSRRSLSPFRKISKELQSKLGTNTMQEANGVADIIRNGFTYLMDSLQNMNHSLKDYRNIAKEELLRQWLLQGTIHEQKDNSEVSLLLSSEYLHLAIIRIETYKYFVDTYNYNSRKLLKYAMGNIAREIFHEAGYISDSVDMGSDHIVLLIGAASHTDAPPDVYVLLENVGTQIDKWLQLRTSIASSAKVPTQDNLRQLYNDVYELTLLKFFNGETKVYSDKDLEDSFQSEQVYPDQSVLNELIQAIKQSDKKRSTELLDRLLGQLKGVSYTECLFQLQMIVYQIYKSFNKVTTMKESVLEEFRSDRFSSLVDARSWIEEEIVRIMESLSQYQVGGRKGELVQEILDYVHDHLQDPMLSVDTIADHLGFSSSYLRHLFKESTQVTLTDFILMQRIEQVKYWLTETDETITIIASKTGFQTKSHFFSAFKKATGFTPSQYRNHAGDFG
ncbi:AraC-like DNA-binding protein [Paenibacillus sp. V4I3]|uniref:helix-turn-helix domain-containing protein n=1 Tax=Paenibacillus sp. V4I3 TaxID=3042305 RepID=UPI00278B220D|nr:AraC family transcriptional regulator [Paenibacillus sp. V4I3]MDQ0877541.1 AraC-like DNA-binding protein [Paenibacillus sp. V4I3]